MKVSDNTAISMPMRNLISIVITVAIGVWGYFGIVERVTRLETSDTLMEADLLKKADQTPKNLEIFMLIEHNANQIAKHQQLLDANIHSQVMIANLEKAVEKAQENIEYLKNLTRKLNGTN